LPIKIIVVKNNTLGQIKWELIVFLGNPEYGCDLLPIDFAAFARAYGGSGFTIEDGGLRADTRRSACDARASPCRSGRRSVDAAHTGQGHAGAGGEVRRVFSARRAEPF
jgi:thiamine pyrophosphate-dependent enzyme